MRATDALPGTALARTVVVGVIAAALGWGSASGAAAAPTPTPSSSSKAEAVGERLTRSRAGRRLLQLVRGGPAAAGRRRRWRRVATDLCQKNVTGNQGTDGSLLGAVVGITASAENAPGEVAANLTDDNPDTKWLAFESTGWVRYQLSAAKKAVTYSLTSANDSPERDPKDVTLQGSADGTTWTDLDRQTGLDFAEPLRDQELHRRDTRVIPVLPARRDGQPRRRHHPARRLGRSTRTRWPTRRSPRRCSPRSAPDPGPGSTSSRSSGGRVSRHCTTPAATPPTGGATRGTASSTSTSRSGRSSQLSYKIIPDMVKGDLTYPSTYAAIDLRFTDGTYLSDLRATDSHHTTFSPSGQGQGKILYAAQWNSVVVDLGPQARGKTVDAILLGYDNTAGAKTGTKFGGWVDDVTIDPAPATVDRTSPLEPRRRATRHQRVGLVLARQQPADQRPAQRVHLLHPGDRRQLPVVGVLVPGGEQRRRTVPSSRASASRTSRPRGWVTATSCRSCRRSTAGCPDRRRRGPRTGLRPRGRDRAAGLLPRQARRRHHGRDGPRRPRRGLPVHLPRECCDGQPRRRHGGRQRQLHRRPGDRDDDGLGRQRQRAVRRTQPDVRLRRVRPGRLGDRHRARMATPARGTSRSTPRGRTPSSCGSPRRSSRSTRRRRTSPSSSRAAASAPSRAARSRSGTSASASSRSRAPRTPTPARSTPTSTG